MGFVECVGGTTGMLLAELIEASCLSIGLDLNLCRGQGYDGAGNMAGHCSGSAKIMQLKYPKAVYFHCASHKLNLCVAHSCKLASVANMMSVISSIAKIEVALDLIEAVIETLSEMSQNLDKKWNRDTVAQSSSLLKSLDFEFIINLVLTQKILAYTSGITTGLQTRGIDLADASGQVKLVIRALSRVRQDVEMFHHTCYDEACRMANKIDVDIKRPRICGRQLH